MGLPLEGIKVLELADSLGSPYCTMMMSDFGADVINVEPLRGARTRNMGNVFYKGVCATHFSLSRNKRTIAVDIKKPQGKDIIKKLAKQSDIVTENFRPGVMDRLGLNYEELSRDNPRLIYLNITGFGPKGPNKDRPGIEGIFQAYSGLMSLQAKDSEGRPMRLAPSICDMAGGLTAFIGIMLALFERDRSGSGQKISIGNVLSVLSMFCHQVQQSLFGGEIEGKQTIAPAGQYAVKDGFWALYCTHDQYWPNICRALNIEHLIEDPLFKDNNSRVEQREALDYILEGILIQKTKAEWEKIFRENDALGAAVRNYKEVIEDPHILANEMVEYVDHPVTGRTPMVGIPIKLSRTPGRVKGPPPTLGQHTVEILHEVGFTDREIQDLRKLKIIAVGSETK